MISNMAYLISSVTARLGACCASLSSIELRGRVTVVKLGLVDTEHGLGWRLTED